MGVRWGKRWLGVACWRHAYSVNPQLRSDSDGWGYNPPQGIAYLWHAFFFVWAIPTTGAVAPLSWVSNI